MGEDLRVSDDLIIPDGELEWRFTTPGGPGGQHANRSATRAELSFDLGRTRAIDDELRERMLGKLGGRASGGVVTIAVDESRSQWQNRQLARERLAEVLREAMRRPRIRRPTRPSAAVKQRRLERKRRRSWIKRLRKPPNPE
ncbi:MAG: alternative ribosome rescue aminoacyl-tRNA hydrolase ArfB [Acidimicrobiia bacterium]